MSLKRRSVGGTPGNSRVRQPFKSPFRSSDTSCQTENRSTSLDAKGAENNLCKESDISVKDCNNSETQNQTCTPTLLKQSDRGAASVYSTPQKVDTGRSPALGDCRRKLVTRHFSSPFRSPGCSRAPQQVMSPEDQLAQLRKREAELNQEILSLQNSGYRSEELQGHIDNLHQYNEVKDAAQVVLGRLAEMEAVTLKEMHEKYGVSANE